MMRLNNDVKVKIMADDYDTNYELDQMPEDFECSVCMMIKDDMMECPQCFMASCKECNINYSKSKKGVDLNANKFECMTCHKPLNFNRINPILRAIFLKLNFKCNDKCK